MHTIKLYLSALLLQFTDVQQCSLPGMQAVADLSQYIKFSFVLAKILHRKCCVVGGKVVLSLSVVTFTAVVEMQSMSGRRIVWQKSPYRTAVGRSID
jgi:hypothetical protein